MSSPRRIKARGGDKTGSGRQKRNLSAFAFSLLISVILWFMLTLSEQHVEKLIFSLSYENLPEQLAFRHQPDTVLRVEVRASGYQLLALKYATRRHLDLDVGQAVSIEAADSRESITLSVPVMPLLKPHFPQGASPFTLLAIDPDTTLLHLETRVSKKVPVVPAARIDFADEFGLLGPLMADPDSVMLSGARSLVEGIASVSTSELKLKGIRTNISSNLAVRSPHPLTGVAPATVGVSAQVDRFTEKVIEIDLPSPPAELGSKVMVLPARGKVTVEVAMSRFEQVTATDFEVVLKETRKGYLEVQVTSKVAYMRVLRFDPPEVAYFNLY